MTLTKAGTKWLFVSDVDDTLLGQDSSLRALVLALEQVASTVAIVYNSSRPCASLRRSIETIPSLPVPDYLIGALGTEIQVGPTGRFLSEYSRHVDYAWNRQRVAEVAADQSLVAHADEFQTPFKASFDIPGSAAYHDIARGLEEEALKAKVIFSGGKNLDIIPIRAGKGNAIHFLRRQLEIDPAHVVVAGDSGNDLEMFAAPYKGIIVANADKDLSRLGNDHIYHASAARAAGVLEGLRYWGVLA